MKKHKIDHYSGIGGQAVLEGVMMRNKDMYAVAVRKPDGDIAVEIDEFHGVAYGSKLLNIPFIFGKRLELLLPTLFVSSFILFELNIFILVIRSFIAFTFDLNF